MATSAPNSGVAGYLAPSESPVYGELLEDVLQDAIAGITGVAGKYVRPRWQPEPAQQPAFNVDWVAFGVTRTDEDVFAHESHDPTEGSGVNIVQRDELHQVLLSFYGPNCSKLAARLAAGLQISQNRASLDAQGIKVVEIQSLLHVPALMKNVWTKRVDVTVVLRRRVGYKFPVNTIASLGRSELHTERFITPIVVP